MPFDPPRKRQRSKNMRQVQVGTALQYARPTYPAVLIAVRRAQPADFEDIKRALVFARWMPNNEAVVQHLQEGLKEGRIYRDDAGAYRYRSPQELVEFKRSARKARAERALTQKKISGKQKHAVKQVIFKSLAPEQMALASAKEAERIIRKAGYRIPLMLIRDVLDEYRAKAGDLLS